MLIYCRVNIFSVLFMSATDEELESVDAIGMDHVTYVLIMLRYVVSVIILHIKENSSKPNDHPFFFSSIAFVIYTLVHVLIHLWGTTGRHAQQIALPNGQGETRLGGDAIELDKWYQRVPAAEADAEAVSQFAIGEHEDD